MNQGKEQSDIFDPIRWGLPPEAVADLGHRLRRVWQRFRDCFRTKTRDTSAYALVYLRGLLTMENKRNFANIARRVIDPDDDGQNLQHFMSDSPWSAQAVFDQIQAEIREQAELQGGLLTLDESGTKCAGPQKAGAARQYIGRLGKVDLGQVGVALGYYQAGIWALVDAELYLPEVWFSETYATLRRRWHIPEERDFMTKPEIGLALIRRAKANGLPFAAVGCDSVYGRDSAFRAALQDEGLIYMADVPEDTRVYLEEPVVAIPETPPGKKGRPFSRWQVVNGVKPVEIGTWVSCEDIPWPHVPVRHTERGLLSYRCTARRVWTLTEEGRVLAEWMFVRQEEDGTCRFSLCNASEETALAQLALWRAQRYFAERIFQDVKSEAGWDELVARKYRAWMHHTALDALALWFVAETKLDWAQAYPRDPALQAQLQLEVLPALSMANVRELLKAVLPLHQLSPEEASRLVVKHLVNRSRSTSSRLKAQRQARDPT